MTSSRRQSGRKRKRCNRSRTSGTHWSTAWTSNVQCEGGSSANCSSVNGPRHNSHGFLPCSKTRRDSASSSSAKPASSSPSRGETKSANAPRTSSGSYGQEPRRNSCSSRSPRLVGGEDIGAPEFFSIGLDSRLRGNDGGADLSLRVLSRHPRAGGNPY